MADNQFLAELLRSNGQARNRAGQPVDAYSTDMFTGAMQGLGNILGGAARGSLTSTLGLGGDINQAIVDNLGTAINAPGLPTTKDVQEMLPYQPTTHEGQVAQKLGEFAPISPKVLGKMVRATKDMPIGLGIRNDAEDFAKKIQELGFEAKIDHSGSKAGLSSYVSVSDPTTGRYIQYPYRFSDHSKGPFQSQFVNAVTDYEKQLPEIQKSILAMREMGVSPAINLEKQQQKQVDELVSSGMKPRTAWKQVLEQKNNQTNRKEILEEQIKKIE